MQLQDVTDGGKEIQNPKTEGEAEDVQAPTSDSGKDEWLNCILGIALYSTIWDMMF